MSARRTQKLIVLLIVLAILYFFAQNNYLNEDATDPSHEVNNNQQPGSQNSIPSENLCGKTIELPRFPAENVDQNRQIFFVETNVQPKPRGRTICALESAIRIGKMPVKVFFRSSVLTVNHPALCSLVKEFYPHKLSFYTTAIEELFERSPLQGITKRLQWNHPLFLLQLSDLMRAVMLYKYGGFYLDQDVLTLRDLTGIRNSIVTDNITSLAIACFDGRFSRSESSIDFFIFLIARDASRIWVYLKMEFPNDKLNIAFCSDCSVKDFKVFFNAQKTTLYLFSTEEK